MTVSIIRTRMVRMIQNGDNHNVITTNINKQNKSNIEQHGQHTTCPIIHIIRETYRSMARGTLRLALRRSSEVQNVDTSAVDSVRCHRDLMGGSPFFHPVMGPGHDFVLKPFSTLVNGNSRILNWRYCTI